MLGLSMRGDRDSADPNLRHETEELARALVEGFFSGGSSCSPSDRGSVPTTAYVSFIQTHDLVGNRVFGERINRLAPPEAVRAVAAIYLLLPQIPMLFMGEEWAATSPFPFFSDYGGELGEAVRRGRAEQLARTGQVDEERLRRAPDPQADSTFLSAKLRWEELNEPLHTAQLDWYRRVLAVRRERIVPLLDALEPCGTYRVHSGGQLECEWVVTPDVSLRLRANLSPAASLGPAASDAFGPADSHDVLWLEGSQPEPGTLGPWSVLWTLERGR
jgi:maltooligosyltrehalose trehalohydrolase